MLAKYIEYTLDGQLLCLAYTVNAMFEINELIGDSDLFQIMIKNDKESLPMFCQIVEILAENGELYRRACGYDRNDMTKLKESLAVMTPKEYLDIKNMAFQAILAGLGREITKENEEYDVGLSELEKKESRPEHSF